MRALVVVDEGEVADDIARALQAAGFVVVVAADGEDAWF
jgi:DNA-binding response OmpR family regulator